MNNGIKVFQNEQFGKVRTLDEDGKVLFCGSDIARALGYQNASKALGDHCKGVTKRYTLTSGGKQELAFISEGDLYRLITHSRLPEAERFERWVFDEVLPTIRQYGAYIPEPERISPDQQTAKIVSQIMEQLLPKLMRWNVDPQYQRKQPYSSLVYALSPEIRQEIEDMLLLNHVGYVEVSNYLQKRYDIGISKSAIGRYAIYLRGKVRDR